VLVRRCTDALQVGGILITIPTRMPARDSGAGNGQDETSMAPPRITLKDAISVVPVVDACRPD
jgi:hypothetical protein